MLVKSTTEKRNVYKDKDGNRLKGFTLPEVLDKPLTILAKRAYTWGRYPGMAVKVANPRGDMAIVEITAKTPIQQLTMPNMPGLPYRARFVQKTSKNDHKYFTVEVLEDAC